jgi:hypothetical protein
MKRANHFQVIHGREPRTILVSLDKWKRLPQPRSRKMRQEILVVLLLWLALQLPLGILVGSCIRFGMTGSDRSVRRSDPIPVFFVRHLLASRR